MISALINIHLKYLQRSKGIIFFTVLSPVMLVLTAIMSAPEGSTARTVLILDEKIIDPAPKILDLLLILNTLTAVVLVCSLTSFFLYYEIKSTIPRLKQIGYSQFQISSSYLIIILVINSLISGIMFIISLYWVDIREPIGYVLGLVLTSFIFSIIGLIIADVVKTKTMGLYSIISLGILDAGFIENPLYSRRFDDPVVDILPAHKTAEVLLRASFDTGVKWTDGLINISGYIIILLLIFYFTSIYQKKI
ncbi:MAG: hypothetical protein OEZ01_13630 [Candidatus Heimdallarchaeota archaeon]|nr:hypothetical protein [Candidatus Heimdallarchaeota archaeon]